MTDPLDLAAVKARSAACKVSHECAHQGYGCERCEAEAVTSAADVPALVAEVERLAAENARLRAVREAAAALMCGGSMSERVKNRVELNAALRAAGGG